MTKLGHGPSLPQAQGPDSDSDKLHRQHHHNHRRLHSHIKARHQHHRPGDNLEVNHVRSHDQHQHKRDILDLDSNPVTEVVQTVQVIQVVDGAGSLIEVKTVLPDPVVAPAGSGSEITAAAAAGSPDSAATAAALSSSDGAPPPDTAAGAPTVSPSPSDSGLLTSTPSPTSTSFPSLPGSYNSTSRPSFTNGTHLHVFANTTKTAHPHANSSFSFSFSTTSSKTLLTSITDVPTLTVFGTVDGAGAGAGGAATLTGLPPSSSTGSGSSGGGILDPTTTRAVVGGVVGGVAGIALAVLAVFIVVKWKARQGQRIQLLAEADRPDNGRMSMFRRSGGSGGGGGGAWAIPAALASLSGYGNRRASQATLPGPETGEKGFYRISGRKLTSVLQSGGDGYGEPEPGGALSSTDDNIRASTISSSSFYRPDSIAMFADPQRSPLQLGSPMRPESGIMIMRSGPARTPVQEQGPMFDDTGHPTPGGLSPPPIKTPPPLSPLLPSEAAMTIPDPVGRSLINQSGSGVSSSGGGSPSRFTERMGLGHRRPHKTCFDTIYWPFPFGLPYIYIPFYHFQRRPRYLNSGVYANLIFSP